MQTERSTLVYLSLVLTLLAASAVIWPWFQTKYAKNWASIEGTFISDARLIKDHWPGPRWYPWWYGGTRANYIYPPALRYGTAALAKYYPMEPARAYHVYTSLLFVMGIGGVWLLAWYGWHDARLALLAAICALFVSPSLVLLPAIYADAAGHGANRLSVLVRYGEGPHMSAFALLGLALAFLWKALRSGNTRYMALSALFCALVTANNFYGSTALAIFYAALLWTFWLEQEDPKLFWRAAIIPVLAFGLCAFWLTPSYLQITLRNMAYVSSKPNQWSTWVLVVFAIAWMLITDRYARRRSDLTWLMFLSTASFLHTLNTVGNYWFNFRILGEAMRLVPELDLCYILLSIELCRRTWYWRWQLGKGLAFVVMVWFLFVARHGIQKPWRLYPEVTDPKPGIEYRMTKRLIEEAQGGRVLAAGTTRFWFNTWLDGYQMGGASEQGVLNEFVVQAYWESTISPLPELTVAWMKVLAVDLIGVHGPRSTEAYHDFVQPGKFQGQLPVVMQDDEDNAIYRVPRRYPGLARVVEAKALAALPKIRGSNDGESLLAHVAVVEQGPESSTQTQWRGSDELRVTASPAAGQSVLVMTTWDANWEAVGFDGRPYEIRPTVTQWMEVRAPQGSQGFTLYFREPLESRIGKLFFPLTVLALLWMWWRGRA
jgi:hypothetical protein